MGRRPGLAVAANAGSPRRCAAPERREARRGFGGINRNNLIGKGAAGNEFRQVGKISLAEHFMHERRQHAIPADDDGSGW